ncbi:class I tRNA ligase family protein [Streptomyces sclerotialus]|uniref:class I tRNA ligase family protein n=1 Tax=Streptomyces sclerotialus TaxID=1957 RepID=UPI0004CB66D8
MSVPLWITATPPAAHGELHIGHLAGPYVAADVLSRALRADGRPVLFTTGTAEHGSSVELRALRTGRKPEEVAEGYRQAICADLLRAGVVFDRIVHPRTADGYASWVGDLFTRLRNEGVLAARTRLMPYCEPCGRWLHGAHAHGTCPHCALPCDGNACPSCARPNSGGELLEPRCALCDTPATMRRCRRLHLPLEPFRDQLADYWAAAELPPRLAALCEQLAEDGLPDVAVCHPGEWGLPVPGEDFAGHRIDACFEAAAIHLFGYRLDLNAAPERTVHFCGFDHAFCQTVLLPALMLAQGIKLPQGFCVNEPLVLDDGIVPGEQPGTVWALDLLTEFGSDSLRRHVLQSRPVGRPVHFSRTDLEQARRTLDATWNSWLTRLFAQIRQDCAGRVPDAEPGGAGWPRLRELLLRTAEDLAVAYAPDSFDPRHAVALLDETVRSVDDFAHINAHERRRPTGHGRGTAALVAQLEVAGALSAWARPVMPEGADRLAAALGLPAGRAITAAALVAPAPGTRLSPPSGPVFGF